jgi:hypothetical protein
MNDPLHALKQIEKLLVSKPATPFETAAAFSAVVSLTQLLDESLKLSGPVQETYTAKAIWRIRCLAASVFGFDSPHGDDDIQLAWDEISKVRTGF